MAKLTKETHPSEADARRVSTEAGAILADVFRAQGWEIRDADGAQVAPNPDQVAAVILELFQDAFTTKRPFLPVVRRDRIMVEVLPDLKAAHVWLRVSDLFWLGDPKRPSAETPRE